MADRTCSVTDCSAPFRKSRNGVDYCGPHYMRAWRYGDPHAYGREPKGWTMQGDYRVIKALGHPLATLTRWWLPEHRIVLFDAIGYGPHCCYWCDRHVNWNHPAPSRLDVDHLDEDKLNNALSNLAPSCKACNSMRNRKRDWHGYWLARKVAP